MKKKHLDELMRPAPATCHMITDWHDKETVLCVFSGRIKEVSVIVWQF